jgi:Undecaprenyl-phosphate glucose phosphotransferase
MRRGEDSPLPASVGINVEAVEDYLPTAAPELCLDTKTEPDLNEVSGLGLDADPDLALGAVPNRYQHGKAATGSQLLYDALGVTPREGFAERRRQRPGWLSPEIVAFLVGGLDWCLVLAAAAAAFTAYSGVMDHSVEAPGRHLLTAFLAATLFVGAFERLGGYRLKQLSQLNWQLTHIPMTWGATLSVVLLVAFLSKTSDTYSRGWTLAWIIATPLLLLVGRHLIHAAIVARNGDSYFARNIAVVGAGDEGQRLIEKLQRGRDKSVVVRGIFDDRKSRLPGSVCNVPVRGTTDDLLRFARSEPIDEIVIALPLHAEQRLQVLCDKMKALAIDVRLSIESLAETFNVRSTGYIGDVPVLEVIDRPLKNWRALAKWTEDKLLGSLLLVFAGPLMVLIAVLIKLDSPGPVLFVQRRFGFNNEEIRVLKFRTMYIDRSDPTGAQRTVRDDPRVTRLGRILRWLSFDELPQLLNVVRGDMSLVGPRPHAIAMMAGGRPYCDAVEQYLHRHRVKPGITGWAQVNGLRGEVDTLEKAYDRVAHDLYYIEHWSLLLDLKIFLMTVGILVSRDNAY